MFIKINKVIIHNFLSYGHAEIDLTDKHYCIVNGQNNKIEDNAANNGSGKSSAFSAICWALTGETIQGLSTNVKNIYVEEDSCYVVLEFSVDSNDYKVIRYKNPKPNLTIEVNGNDVSGKGIRESEAILKQYLPDMSSQLLASIIILGQGLPYKFTANTPSGRKEVLEKLSKSDFMIQDLKERITKRSIELNQQLRCYQDLVLADSSKKEVLEKQLEEQKVLLEKLKEPKNFSSDLEALNTEENNLSNSLLQNQQHISTLEVQEKTITDKLTSKNKDKNDTLKNINDQFNVFTQEYLNKRSSIAVNKTSLETRIKDIESIKDVCPTCGQKLPNVEKPSCENEKQQLLEVINQLTAIDKKYTATKTEHLNYERQINEDFNSEISGLNFEFKQVKQSLELLYSDKKVKESQLLNIRSKKVSLELEKKNYEQNIKNAETALTTLEENIKILQEKILYNIKNKDDVCSHIEVINKMITLIKRDFRGYLLSEIITYIASKVKEYSLEVFGNDSLQFVLEGNNINISYCGRSFENLSGGEKQRVDLIVQFAIRDMMQHYLDFSSNILVLDEIFDQLDATGCTNILTLILNKLTDVESIFIISHRASELEIPYDCEMLVIKDEKGVSSIRWQ